MTQNLLNPIVTHWIYCQNVDLSKYFHLICGSTWLERKNRKGLFVVLCAPVFFCRISNLGQESLRYIYRSTIYRRTFYENFMRFRAVEKSETSLYSNYVLGKSLANTEYLFFLDTKKSQNETFFINRQSRNYSFRICIIHSPTLLTLWEKMSFSTRSLKSSGFLKTRFLKDFNR